MTTAEAIEAITDAGEFEILATRVLRITDEDCWVLEHMGVNAAGKTIRNPIDSFCRVPGTNPPRFVMAAFTTERAESLERKWLFVRSPGPNIGNAESADDGDLVKAHRRAEELRKYHPGATFAVHLCTNKQPDDRLIAKAFRQGLDYNLEVRFLTRSVLRDFLDVNPDGQWLRREHLSIEATRLSLPLLRELSLKSLQQYGKEFLITSPETFVPTSSKRALETSLESSRSVHVITGPSGCGKSVSCYQVLHDHLENGGVGLWIPGEMVASASSLEEAIGLTLHSLNPMMEATSGAIALGLGNLSHRLYIVIDDINRCISPTASLRKILAWGRPSSNGDRASSSPFVVLLPAWDIYWAPFDKQFVSANWLTRVLIDRLGEDEALSCLAAVLGPRLEQCTDADQERIVTSLGNDPVLIALFAASTGELENLHLPIRAINAINSFVQTAEDEAAASHGQLRNDYDLALSHLATQILRERDLYPRWQDVHQWLPPNEAQAIRELCHLEKMCRVTERAGEDRFGFRHDRILEHFLVRALQQDLSDREANAPVLTDPFYASFVGQAMASIEPSDELIEWIKQHAPLALISSVRFLSAASDDMADRIATAAKDWLTSAFDDPSTLPVLLFEAYRLFEGIDAPHLLTITQSLALHPLLARARLANGDAAAGVVEFSDPRYFAPSMNDRGLDAVLNRAIHRHKRVLIAGCVEMLQNPKLTEANRRGALILAGFIADASLAAPVRTAWDLAATKSNILQSALWAGIRCAASEPGRVLDEMMLAWAALPANDIDGGLSERNWIAQELQFAARRGIVQPVLDYLVSKARSCEALRWPITFMMECVDHPLVVTFLLEEISESERRTKGTKGFSPWAITQVDRWDPTMETRGKRLSPEAVQAIMDCWQSQTDNAQLRETAFRIWIRTVDDVNVLRAIPTDHPQFESVLWRRARLGDTTAIPYIKSLVAVSDRWFHVIHRIWSAQFKDVLDKALLSLKDCTPADYTGGQGNAHYTLAHLLRDIPADDAQPLILKHWDHLRFSRLFIQAALYIGSPECVGLATKELKIYPPNCDAFEHLNHFFGFQVTGFVLVQREMESSR